MTDQTEEQEIASYKLQLDQAKANAVRADKEAEENNLALQSIKKIVAIKDAASSLNFFDLDLVTRDVEKRIHWDAGRNRLTVMNDNGVERFNSRLDPMSVEEYLTEYAGQKPYLVRSNGKKGATVAESPAKGQHRVEDIFGKKSVGKLANRLALDNMPEYKRLKAIAVASGIV